MATRMAFDRTMVAINLSSVQYAQVIRIGALNIQSIRQQASLLTNRRIVTLVKLSKCRIVMNMDVE